jgi:hypothetical protein
VARGDVIVVHVPDEHNAADFLTKWIPVAKLNASLAYTSNAEAKKDFVNAPPPLVSRPPRSRSSGST